MTRHYLLYYTSMTSNKQYFLHSNEIQRDWKRMGDIFSTWMRPNDFDSTWITAIDRYLQYTQIRANNIAIFTFSRFNKEWLRIDWELTNKWSRINGKYHSWPIMTDITHFHFLFMKSQLWDFLKQSCPVNLSYCPAPTHSVMICCPWMAIPFMLATQYNNHIRNTSFSSWFMNGPNKQDCYIILGWKVLPGANPPANDIHL